MSVKAPTVGEQAWMDSICRIGCCVCIRTGLGPTPGEVHHILDAGNRKMGHMYTICLCPSHHRAELNNAQIVSRHHWRKEFVSRYGTEFSLLDWTKQKVVELARMTV